MPDRPTVSNTSPLLYLALVGQLDLLAQLYGELWVPPGVLAELKVGAERGVEVPDIRALPWITAKPLASDSSIPLVTDLGRGEAEVIALGLEIPDSRLILDDRLGRRIAELHGLHFTGTAGVILKAKQAGLLVAVSPVISSLRQAGLWLSDVFVAEILRQAGEA